MTFLKVSNLGKLRQGEWVVKDVKINLDPFRKLAIAGETGSGKSSLLQMIAGIINPDEGEVIFENNRVKKVPEEKLLPGHPGIAYLSQQFELPHHMRVEEVLAYANELEEQEAARLYEICQVDHLVKRRTDQLSGGERQRIALARLLGTSPRLLLLDEPYSNLDPIHKNTLKSVINDISGKLAMTCVLVSHDPLDTVGWADEIIVLHHGQMLQHDTPEKIYYQPVNEYAAGLFGKYNRLNEAMRNVFKQYISSDETTNWCIRPHQWSVSDQIGQGVEGTVKDVHFIGPGYELLVECAGLSIHAFTTRAGWKTGNTVFVSVDI